MNGIERPFLRAEDARTSILYRVETAAAVDGGSPAAALAQLFDEWRAVRAAILETVRTVPGAREAFRAVIAEYAPRCKSPEWDVFFV